MAKRKPKLRTGYTIPYPAAFRETAIEIRKEIRAKRKKKLDTLKLLSELYYWAVVQNFFTEIKWGEIINERLLKKTALSSIERISSPYHEIGFENLELLGKTDVKWLVEAIGEPRAHSTARKVHRKLWKQAVRIFRVAAKREEGKWERSLEQRATGILDKFFGSDDSIST